jgi:hypothetical protein
MAAAQYPMRHPAQTEQASPFEQNDHDRRGKPERQAHFAFPLVSWNPRSHGLRQASRSFRLKDGIAMCDNITHPNPEVNGKV